jgi:signal peptidase I
VRKKSPAGYPRRLVKILTAIGLGFAFLAVAPSSLGGGTTWARTSGISMQPGIHAGDLVIARPRSAYRIGDVVAYHSRTLAGTTIVHRIIEVTGNGLVTKGDNNHWLDPDRPLPAEVLGAVFVHIPQGGDMLAMPVNPFVIAGMVLVGAAGVGAAARRSRSRSRSRCLHRGRGRASRRARGPIGVRAPDSWPVHEWAGAAAVTALLVAAVAFGQPVGRAATTGTGFRQTADLGYSARVPTSGAYPDGRVRTGDPVFLSLAPELDVHLRYQLEAPAGDVTGTVRSLARVSTGNGWKRSVVLTPSRGFTGPSAEQSAVLDLRAIRRLLDSAQKAAGTGLGGATVDVVHEVHVQGTVDGRPFDATYRPEVSFTLDAVQALPTAASTPTGRSDSVRRTDEGSMPPSAVGAATLKVLRWTLPAAPVRILAVVLAGAAAALAAEAARRRRRRSAPMPLFANAVTATGMEDAGRCVVDLEDAESLRRLAGHHDLTVVHLAQAEADIFLAVRDETVYRYVAR